MQNWHAEIQDLSVRFPEIDGAMALLGTDFFRGLLLKFDFQRKQLRVKKGSLPEANNLDTLDMSGDLQSIRLPAGIDDVELELTIAPGSARGFIFPAELAGRLPLSAEPQPVPGSGDLLTSAHLESAIRIGEFLLESQEIFFERGRHFASMGGAALQRFVITLDPSNRRIALDDTQDNFIRGAAGFVTFGLRIDSLEGESATIAGIVSFSAADRAAIRAGDVIVAMNGIRIDDLSPEARVAALKGKTLILIIRRGDEEMEKRLKLTSRLPGY
jgi:hypothetical protein